MEKGIDAFSLSSSSSSLDRAWFNFGGGVVLVGCFVECGYSSLVWINRREIVFHRWAGPNWTWGGDLVEGKRKIK